MDTTTDARAGDGKDRSARLSWLGLFAVAVWGASFVATRVALTTVRPFGLVAIRLALGAALLLAVVAWRQRARLRTLLGSRREAWAGAGLAHPPRRGIPHGKTVSRCGPPANGTKSPPGVRRASEDS